MTWWDHFKTMHLLAARALRDDFWLGVEFVILVTVVDLIVAGSLLLAGSAGAQLLNDVIP